jgi:hypothetical protein
MDVWCNWCGAHARVTHAEAGQWLGCVACRRLFTVPGEYGVPRVTEADILRILVDRPARITEDEVLGILSGVGREAVVRAKRAPRAVSPYPPGWHSRLQPNRALARTG